MVFRGHDSEQGDVVRDPLTRFFALEQAFEDGRGMFGDRVPLRLVAANLVLTPGEPEEIATEVRTLTELVSEHFAWHSGVALSIRLLIAAILLQRGDTPAAFLSECDRARAMMRDLGMRRMQVYEVAAILALRIRSGLEPITRGQIERMRDIYEAMKSNHWLLTGPEDYPACAFLVGQAGSPQELGDRASAIYHALRRQAKLWRGDPLQTAANILPLGSLEPEEIAERFRTLAVAFDEAGVRIRAGEYDEVAILCFLARPSDKIVETVVGYRDEIKDKLRWMDRFTAFGLAGNLAFARLVGNDPELGPLADAKILLDMQAVIAARQAAAAGAAAGAG